MSDLYSTPNTEEQQVAPSSAPQTTSSDVDEPAPKRRQPRTQQACESCRIRKTRCGGERPVCLACARRGVGSTCSYERNGVKRKAPAHSSAELDDRDRQYSTPAGNAFAPINRTLSDDRGIRRVSNVTPKAFIAERHVVSQAPRENGVYGPSSAVAFLNTISDEPLSASQPSQAPKSKSVNNRNSSRPPEKMFVSDGTQSLLPRRREVDDYVRCFWESTHPLFPILHKPSFMNQYEQLWSSHDIEQRSEFDENMFMSALNIVFAIGCRFSNLVRDDQKAAMADEFYQRSRRTFCYDVLDTTTLSMIQYLLLVVAYLQSTHHAVRCWNAVGLAMRASQSMGLHIDCPDSDKSQLQMEMRRRIWHTCITLDRLVAMVFGRPAATQKTQLSLPALIDDEYLGDKQFGVQPHDQIPRLGLFTYSCQLFDVLEDVLSSFYSERSIVTTGKSRDNRPHDMVTSVMSFTKRIDSLVARLPEWLVVEPDENSESHVYLQQRVLHSRILYARLLSTRPLLSLATDRNLLARVNTHTLEDEFIRSCCARCLDSALELIETTHHNMQEMYRSSAAHTTIYTCSALMTLLAVLKSDLGDWNNSELHDAWDRAITIIEYYQEQVPAAAEGLRQLQTLKQRMWTAHKIKQGEETALYTHGRLQKTSDLPLELGFDDITDAWFSQYFFDASWLEPPAL